MTLDGMRIGGVFRMFGSQHHNVGGAAAGLTVDAIQALRASRND